jgi:hypothetical protein
VSPENCFEGAGGAGDENDECLSGAFIGIHHSYVVMDDAFVLTSEGIGGQRKFCGNLVAHVLAVIAGGDVRD